MSHFRQGQTVRGLADVQGIYEGEFYWISEVITKSTAFGDFVTYILEDEDGQEYAVGNGHLVLGPVTA